MTTSPKLPLRAKVTETVPVSNGSTKVRAVSLVLLSILVLNCTTTTVTTKSEALTPAEYDARAEHIWRTYVPPNGQARFIQGELLRSVEKLRDEAQRNGNANFSAACHGALLDYLGRQLNDDKVFDAATRGRINQYLGKISSGANPYLDDDAYDYLTNRVVDWNTFYGNDRPHVVDEKLRC